MIGMAWGPAAGMLVRDGFNRPWSLHRVRVCVSVRAQAQSEDAKKEDTQQLTYIQVGHADFTFSEEPGKKFYLDCWVLPYCARWSFQRLVWESFW